MITRILVPTDFSANARHACRYAQALQQQFPTATLRLLHAFMPNVEAEFPTIATPVVDHLHVREAMLRDFAAEMGIGEYELRVGFAADELVRWSEQVDLIVMGTRGEGDTLSQWFGSVSSAVAQRAVCPVLLVPPSADFQAFANILYASSYDSIEKAVLNKLLDFNVLFNATVHFVHVRDTKAEAVFEPTKEELFRQLFAHRDPVFAFEMAEINAASVREGLEQYAADHLIDLVVMAHRQRGFWEGFFHRSQTKDLALHAQLPILIFHLPAE